MFNIFANFPKLPSKEETLEAYLKKNGITLEQYRQELKEQEDKAHAQYLREHNLTEEKYLKQQKRRQRLEKCTNVLKGICCILVIPVFVAIVSGILSLVESSDVLKIVLLSIFVLVLAAVICVPVFIVVFKVVQQSGIRERWHKILIGLFCGIVISAVIMFLLMQCSNGFHYEPGKLRPDRF